MSSPHAGAKGGDPPPRARRPSPGLLPCWPQPPTWASLCAEATITSAVSAGSELNVVMWMALTVPSVLVVPLPPVDLPSLGWSGSQAL
jgi:hypothetical protein